MLIDVSQEVPVVWHGLEKALDKPNSGDAVRPSIKRTRIHHLTFVLKVLKAWVIEDNLAEIGYVCLKPREDIPFGVLTF